MAHPHRWSTVDSSQTIFRLATLAATQPPHQQPPIPPHVHTALQSHGLHLTAAGTVSFHPTSPTHPRHWPLPRKLHDTLTIILLESLMTLVSNTGSAIAPFAAPGLGISREKALACFTTAYMGGQALGGLIFPPIAESFGGRAIYVASTAGFALGCVALGAWGEGRWAVVVGCRFVTGLLSAMPCVVATGSLENMWDMRARTFVVHVWICAAVVGLAVGPGVGTFVSAGGLGWPWVFNISAIVTAAGTLLCSGMRESRPCQVLRQEVRAVAKETGFDDLSVDGENSLPTLRDFFWDSLLLPLRLFFTEPIIWLTSIMAATVYGIVYLFSESLSIVYLDSYGFSVRQGSLVILAIAVGVVLTFLPRFYDLHIVGLRRRQGVPLQPEDKLSGFYIAAPILAAGLWWFAWTVPPLVNGISPWVSIASLVLVGFSVVEFDNVLCGYLCDTYASYAGSANAPMAFLRAILSGCFPLFGHQLFHNLGANIALFILASVATAYCAVAFVFGRFGRTIRERSPFAEKAWSASQEKLEALDMESTVSLPESCHVKEKRRCQVWQIQPL